MTKNRHLSVGSGENVCVKREMTSPLLSSEVVLAIVDHRVSPYEKCAFFFKKTLTISKTNDERAQYEDDD